MKDKYIDDLKDIKEMMNRSSRFISLSGLSGILAGLAALVGAYFAFSMVFSKNDYLVYEKLNPSQDDVAILLFIAVLIIFLTLTGGIYFTTRKSIKENTQVWDSQSKRMLINLSIPLVTGGILCLLLISKGYVGFTLPVTLIFYGLALVNASKYSLAELRSLGLAEIVLGLLAFEFLPYSQIFWAIGFGILHIIYGLLVHWKYKS